jgi:hypothetical protein
MRARCFECFVCGNSNPNLEHAELRALQANAWLIFIQRKFSQRIFMLQNSIAIVASQ